MKTLILSGVMALATPLAAQDLPVGDADEGAWLYLTYCATCHGLDAKGSGPMSGALILQPPDLTLLTEKYAGAFPIERVATRIDGRDPLVSHGSPMPVYGDYFEGDDTAIKVESGQPLMTSRPVVDLIAFLMAAQAQ